MAAISPGEPATACQRRRQILPRGKWRPGIDMRANPRSVRSMPGLAVMVKSVA
jgi:hypothetical protein